MEKDVVRELKGKKVKISVAFMNFTNGATTPKIYEGIVDCGAAIGSNHFIVFENGTMINFKYLQTIEIL